MYDVADAHGFVEVIISQAVRHIHAQVAQVINLQCADVGRNNLQDR
jgi:hypothetical protein